MESQLAKTLHMSRIKRRQIASTQRKLLMKMNDNNSNNNMRKKGEGGKGGSCRKTTTIFANKSELCLPGAAETAVTDELNSTLLDLSE